MSTPSPRIRIDIVVRELPAAGAAESDELRFVRFGEELYPVELRDFFERSTQGLEMLFNTRQTYAIAFSHIPIDKKIETIKLLRNHGYLGLKEAKDLVEAPLGTPVLAFSDSADIRHVVGEYDAVGVKVAVRQFNPEVDDERRPIGVPRTPTYVKR